MKTKITLLIFLIAAKGFAQNGINYKAIIKDGSGNIVANSTITVRFSIIEGGTTIYLEDHAPTTDENGLVILVIGEGTTGLGAFSTIDWGSDDYFLRIYVDTGDGLINLGATPFNAVPYALHAANVSGLEAMDAIGGIGWRLKGRNPAAYGDLGGGAIDLSNSNGNVFESGAVGIGSIAMGLNTKAASEGSTAMGHSTLAYGDYSTTMGRSSRAFGYYATAMGFNTKADTYAATAIGHYNVGAGGSFSAWVLTDPLFEIGNGADILNRQNAMTVLKSGKTGINTATPTSMFEVVHGNTDPTASNRTDTLSITNRVLEDSWQFHLGNTNGSLILFRNGAYRGYFDWTSGAYVQPSDRNLKTAILPLEDATLKKVLQLNPL